MKKNIITIGFTCILLILFVAVMGVPITKVRGTTRITVSLRTEKDADSLILVLWPETLGVCGFFDADIYIPQIILHSGKNRSGTFVFEIPKLTKPGYFSIYKDKRAYDHSPVFMLEKYLIAPNDNVTITFSESGDKTDLPTRVTPGTPQYLIDYRDVLIHFSGKGFEKYICRYNADLIYQQLGKAQFIIHTADYHDGLVYEPKTGKYIKNNIEDVLLEKTVQAVDAMKSSLDKLSYEVLMLDVIGRVKSDLFYGTDLSMAISSSQMADSNKVARVRGMMQEFTNRFENEDLLNRFSLQARLISECYSAYFIEKARCKSRIAKFYGTPFDEYEYLKTTASGQLRERIITTYLVGMFRFVPNNNIALSEALNTFSTPFYFRQLKVLQYQVGIGATAYNFELPDSFGHIVKLKDFKGKVVMMDFWYTGCAGCSNFYLTKLSKVEKYFKSDTNIVFITISPDVDKNMWLKSIATGKFTSSTDAINLYTAGDGNDHPVIKAYHVWGYPHPLIIDKTGKISGVDGNLQIRKSDELITIIKNVLKKA